MSDLEKQPKLTSFEPLQPQSGEGQPDPNESELARILAALGPVPERDPRQAARSQARFLSELEALNLPDRSIPLPIRLRGWLRDLIIGKKKEETNMSTPTQRFAFSTFALIALIAVFLFGGAGTTVFAAQSALPGDALFRVKTSLEQTRTSLSGSASDRAELHLEFAERRMNEIARLASQGRFNDIAAASTEFETHISAAEHELETVEKEHPEQSAALSQKISADLTRFGQTLAEIKHQVPDDIKGEVEHAIQSVQPTPAPGDNSGLDDKSQETLEPGEDTGTPEPGDDKGGQGAETLQPRATDDNPHGDDKGGSTGSLTATPGADDHGGSGSGSLTATPGADDHGGSSSGSGSNSGSGSGSANPTPTPSSNNNSGSGGGSGSGSGGGDDGGGHK